jgi:hypothetical protein
MCLKINISLESAAELDAIKQADKKKFKEIAESKYSSVAEEDITVYKLVYVNKKLFKLLTLFGMESAMFVVSPVKKKTYRLRKNYKVKSFGIELFYSSILIEYGLHSWRTLAKADEMKKKFFQDAMVFTARIPKGSRYFKGVDDICSDRLVIDGVNQEVEQFENELSAMISHIMLTKTTI